MEKNDLCQIEVDLQCEESLSSARSYSTSRAENSIQLSAIGTKHWDEISIEEQYPGSGSSKRRISSSESEKQLESVGKVSPCTKTPKKKSSPWKKDSDLNAYIDKLLKVRHPDLPLGTRVWTRVFGSCDWPSVIWSLDLCPKVSWQELIEGYTEGKCLILFYGERSIMWVKPTQLSLIHEKETNRVNNLIKWGERNSKSGLALAALDEFYHSFADPVEELSRIHSAAAFDYCSTSFGRLNHCEACSELGPEPFCDHCKKGWHTICLDPPILNKKDLKEGETWKCPSCQDINTVTNQEELQKTEITEATGLTPDWIIHAAAYDVFLLQKPTAEYPYIKNLLDPCTNNKANPNIPAEKLYDKHDNGLKLSNSWSGYYIILNPDYKSQVQWRFVNRAVDEVESDRVPAVILVCRNSTDAAYYQRLRPYPRVLLRRQCVRFKNYEHTPIGFGIVVFCIAKQNWRELYGRFYDAFSSFGEMNMPIDLNVLRDPEFTALLRRVQEQAAVSHRDHWVQCKDCKKWRIVSYEMAQKFKDKDWHCTDLKPRCSSCTTLQRKVEVLGVIYASGVEHDYDPDVSTPSKDSVADMHMQEDPLSLTSEESPIAEAQPIEQWIEESPPEDETNDLCTADSIQQPGEDLTSFARRVCCCRTLESLVSLPLKNSAHKIQNYELQTSESLSSDLSEHSVLSSLDLARQSRMAANRAYLKGLGKEPSAIHRGEIAPLPATNGLIADAATSIFKRAEIANLEFQIQKALRRCQEIKRKRQTEEAHLHKELEKKIQDESEARRSTEIALDAVKQLEARLNQLKSRKPME